MKLKDYCKDRLTAILGTIAVVFILSEFLYIAGNTFTSIFLIDFTLLSILFIKNLIEWYRRKEYFKAIRERVEDLEYPWLISELLPVSYRAEDRLYQELLRLVGSSAIEQIHKTEDETREYEEYIEEWIHEVKAPITSMQLMIENRAGDNPILKKGLNIELGKIENDVERALYYARSEQVYKDYLIQKLNLHRVLVKAINRNRTILMNCRVKVEFECGDDMDIYGDEKWLIFLISQILLNSVKYRSRDEARIVLSSEKKGKKIILKIWDNGTGIKEEELPRIFEKGFTGSNGRENERSTGIGLYLVKKLCQKLDIEVWAESSFKEYTAVYLALPAKQSIYSGQMTKL